MEAIIERCCGLDVHRDSIMACLLTGKADEKPQKQLRTFGTMSHDLREMAQWLRENGCTHVAMESTGVYWMAPYKALEPHVELIVGNAQHLSKVPGRKTDVLDSEWLAELLRHGLIRKSFIPPPPIRELRDLTRYRRKLVQSRSAERNRLHKLLESANIKLASVMSDVFGASGMDMLRALVDGELKPKEIAKLARGQLRKKMDLLALALDAPFEEHHRYLLRTQLSRLEQLDGNIAEADARIAQKLAPYAEQHARLTQIPGVDRVVASVIIAELGVDMSVFASPQACASWAGVSPGNNESAGKRKSGRTPRGNPHLKSMLVEAALAASRKKGSYLRDKFHRIRARRGYKRAVVAIAHKILIAAYFMLATGEDYRELGEGYLDVKDEQRLTKRLVNRLEGLGYQVTLQVRESETEAPSSTQTDGATESVHAVMQEAESAARLDEHARAADPVELKVSQEAESPAPRSDELNPATDQVDPEVIEESPAPRADEGETAVAQVDTELPAASIDTVRGQEQDSTESSADTHEAMVEMPSVKRKSRSVSTPSDISVIADANETASASSPDHEQTVAPTASPLTKPSRQNDRARRSKCKRAPRSAKSRDPRLPPAGTTLTRVFKDVEYRVLVLEDRFEYDGEVYSSISRVAKTITGTSYNGYVFFRLTKKRKKQKESAAHTGPPE